MNKLYLMEQVYASLMVTSNKLQQKGDRALGRLTSRQLMVMIAILHLEEGKASYNQLAEKLGTSKQNIKQLIMSLEKKAFIQVQINQKDKRANQVCLTHEGREVLQEAGRKGSDFLREVAQKFSEEELETLWQLLKKLYAFDSVSMRGFEEEVGYKLRKEES